MISIFLFCSRDERDFGLEAETEIRLVSVLVSSCSALFWFYSYVLYSHFVSVLIAFLFFYYFLIHSNSFIFPFLLCLFSFWFHSYSLSFWSYSSLSWHSVLIPFCFCSHSVIIVAWRLLQSIETPRGLWFLVVVLESSRMISTISRRFQVVSVSSKRLFRGLISWNSHDCKWEKCSLSFPTRSQMFPHPCCSLLWILRQSRRLVSYKKLASTISRSWSRSKFL